MQLFYEIVNYNKKIKIEIDCNCFYFFHSIYTSIFNCNLILIAASSEHKYRNTLGIPISCT